MWLSGMTAFTFYYNSKHILPSMNTSHFGFQYSYFRFRGIVIAKNRIYQIAPQCSCHKPFISPKAWLWREVKRRMENNFFKWVLLVVEYIV